MAEQALAEQTEEAQEESNPGLDAAFEKHGIEPDTPKDEQTKPDSAEDDKPESAEPETEESDDTEESSFSKAQIDAAKFLGVDPEHLAALDDSVIDGMMKRRAEHDAKIVELRKQKAEPASSTESSDEREVEQTKEPAKSETFEPLTGDTLFDEPEKTATAINSLRDELVALREDVATFKASAEEQIQSQTDKEVDTWFNGLDGRIFARYGNGPMGMLGPDSDEARNRNELVEIAEHFVSEDVSWSDALEMAIFRIAKDDVIKMETARRASKNRTKNRGSMTPPTGSKVAEHAVEMSDELNAAFDKYGIGA